MKKEPRLRDTRIYDDIKNILSYYECPPDCGAYCCKIQDIEMDTKDLKALRNVSKTKTADLDSTLHNGIKFYKLDYPCIFLSESDKCEAYRHRPTVCRVFPFNSDAETGMFTIRPCKMGVNILEDLFKFRSTKLGLPVPAHAAIHLKKSHEEYYNDVDGNPQMQLFGISLDHLTSFSKYLDSK